MSVKLAGKLFTQRRFLPLFTLFQAGTFNDNALKNALIALVVFGGMVLFSDAIPREAIVPIAALIFTLPFLILCTIAGQIADKYDRGLILKWIKRAEVGIMAIAFLGFWFESPAILALALGLMGCQSAFFSPTKNAVLPQWLADKELITGNGLLSGFQFFMILLGMVVGTLIVLTGFAAETWLTGPRLVGIILFVLALFGWVAAEFCPPAPAPAPQLKVNWNPVTAIISVLVSAWKDQPVFRPMAGIAWFYAVSTVFVTAFPVYIADVMKYDSNVLIVVLASATIGILIGSLLCIVLSKGREAIGVCAAGIVGVTLCTLLLCLYPSPEYMGAGGLGTLPDFLDDPNMPVFMGAVVGASLFNGLYVVPLQAMAQGRAFDTTRARMMSAGAVMLNLAVNVVTFGLIGLGFTAMPAIAPFYGVTLISAGVAVYAIYRVKNPPQDLAGRLGDRDA